MATAVIMPRQGQSVESCIITKWHKKVGDQVNVGDLLFSYETDKASFDEEAKVEGILLDVFFKEDDDVPCLQNVCVIGNEGESTKEYNPNEEEAEVKETENDRENQVPVNVQAEVSAKTEDIKDQVTDGDKIKISPRARILAERSGIDYRYADSSGPNNRIIEKDIISLKESGHVMTSAARAEHMKGRVWPDIEGTGIGGRIIIGDLEGVPARQEADIEEAMTYEVKVPNIRKVIARAMHNSLSTTAQLTLNASFDATDILKYRKKIKENAARLELENITLNDIILYAVSRTLPNHKDLNAHFLDDRMLYFKNVNLGVAVDTPRGLMVPTVFNANLKSLNEVSKEVKGLIGGCQAGTINPDSLRGGSFTVTNLGTLDVESFTPVLNAPQTGILGVNTIVQRAKEVDGEYTYYPAMGLSLTFDHRALDGAPAAKFLKELKTNLESFSVMLAK